MNEVEEMSSPVGLEFYASLSHEIRNPLNAIIGLSRLLKSVTSEEDRKKYLDSLHETSEGLLELVNNIMDFSKLESGKVDYTPRPTDLRQLLDQSLFSQISITEAKGVELRVEIDEKLPSLMLMEPVKIRQVIWNLDHPPKIRTVS